MKSILTALLTSLLLSLSTHTLADYIAGEQANQKGDRSTAFKEFTAAAEQKDIRAYGKLGSFYLYGLGTEKDYHKAYIWFNAAYLTGDINAARFRDAASSTMTRKQYDEAVEAAEKLRIKQGIELPKPTQRVTSPDKKAS